jgi:hypothetical protein
MKIVTSKKKACLRYGAFRVAGTVLRLWMGIWLVLILADGDRAAAQHNPKLFSPPDEKRPAAGETVSMARATWDTGWFQTEIFKRLLEELGYAVNEPRTMDNLAFYLSVARGEMDLWANGWFPSHHIFLEDARVGGRVEAVGFEVKAGALQGYLVDKKTADDLGITNLGDLKDPKIAAVFLAGQGIPAIKVESVDKAYPLLESGKADAIVYDAPVLQHHASGKGKGKVKVVGLLFQEQHYGIALQVRSPYREKISIALLKLIESGEYRQIVNKWFGS